MPTYERVFLKCLKSQGNEFEELAVPTWMTRLTEPRAVILSTWAAVEKVTKDQVEKHK